MNAACQNTMAEVGNGVAAALRAVDCAASDMTGAAFGRLFAPGGALGPVLSILLGLFIAFFAIALMLGRTNLSIRSLVPRMITLGLVLTFATSWLAYQTVVWNLAIGAPDYLATVLTGGQGSATTTFADKIDIVFGAIERATQAQAGGEAADISAFSPMGMLWLGAMLLLLGTVGVLVTARIGLAVLLALGPIFVVLALFNGTRGLFTGWLKGVVMLALTPLFAVLGGSLMLELAVPVLASLNAVPGQVDMRSAMAFFLIGAVHVALMIMVLKVSATMVSGWRVFGLADKQESSGSAIRASAAAGHSGAAPLNAVAAPAIAAAPSRQIPLSGIVSALPANDAGAGSVAGAARETRIISSPGSSAQVQPISSSTSRTSGIGNRFRPANTRPAHIKSAGSRLTEKTK